MQVATTRKNNDFRWHKRLDVVPRLVKSASNPWREIEWLTIYSWGALHTLQIYLDEPVSHADFVGWVKCNVTHQPPLMGYAIAPPILQIQRDW